MSEFVFGPSEWEMEIERISDGSSFSAARFLTLMEGETESGVEDALLSLQEKDVILDVSDLPTLGGVGEAAIRLRREEQLVKEGGLPYLLEENDPLRLYLEEIAAIPACGDVQLLAERLLAGEKNVVQQLTNLMLSRVYQRACEMVGRGVLLLDLIQEGSLGLWEGLLGYAGGDIEAHCDRYIRRDLARAVTMQARNCGVGQKLRTAMEDYRAVDERLLAELGRNPTVEEMAEAMHLSVEQTVAVANMLEAARTLERAKTVKSPEESDPEDAQAVEDTAYFQMRQRIAELLSELDKTEAQLLTLRFGLEGGKPMTPEETGRKLGLTPEEVVAKEAAALAKLRGQR